MKPRQPILTGQVKVPIPTGEILTDKKCSPCFDAYMVCSFYLSEGVFSLLMKGVRLGRVAYNCDTLLQYVLVIFR
jgi:hypothetical protein